MTVCGDRLVMGDCAVAVHGCSMTVTGYGVAEGERVTVDDAVVTAGGVLAVGFVAVTVSCAPSVLTVVEKSCMS